MVALEVVRSVALMLIGAPGAAWYVYQMSEEHIHHSLMGYETGADCRLPTCWICPYEVSSYVTLSLITVSSNGTLDNTGTSFNWTSN